MAVRRPRKSVVAIAGDTRTSDSDAMQLVRSLEEIGIQTSYKGRVDDPKRIAAAVRDEGADAVEICLGADGAVMVLLELLHQLTVVGRRDASIVVHRIR
jgi:methylmalonyl-CoA mutase cobalamin-binding subunit